MKNIVIIFLLLIGAIVFRGCIKPEYIVQPDLVIESLDDLIVPADFDWKTTQTLNVSVVLPDNGTLKPLTITNSDGTKRYFRGYPDDGSRTLKTIITIPSYIKNLNLTYDDFNISDLNVVGNNSLSYNFNTSNKLARKKSISGINLGLIADFTLFSTIGAVTNTGISDVTGDIGANFGLIDGFGFPSVLNGNIQNSNNITAQAALDLKDIITQLNNTVTTVADHAPAFGAETLNAGVYAIAGASSIGGTLTLDAQGDSNAEFIFKIAGAFTTGAGTEVILINGASPDNIYWIATGSVAMAASTSISGTIIANPGAVSMGAGGELNGRMLSDVGAVSLLTSTLLVPDPNKTNIEVSSLCTDLGVTFTITNTGDSMTDSFGYTLFKNDEEILSESYQLELDESIEITSAALTDDNFKLVAATPNQGDIEESIEGCGDFPSEEFGGSLAFEDLYPAKGDYDFNDLVLDYNFNIFKNNQEIVQSITATFVIKAFGAASRSGFGFSLPTLNPNNIVSVNGYQVTNNTVFSIASNGLENNQSEPTIIVFDDAYRVMPPIGGGTGANTQSSFVYNEPVTIVIEIDMNNDDNPVTFSELNIGAFNPFMIVDTEVNGEPGSRGKEIHLANYKPSDLFDAVYFQQLNDDSSVAEEKYFLTTDNLPWAMNVAEEFEWVMEYEDITNAYNMFSEWAQSSGNMNADWYQDKSGFRNNSLIYR
jgi:LruC domain-containing protein